MRTLALAMLLVCVATVARSAEVGDLVKQLKSKDADERRAAARELGSAGADPKTAVPALVAALKDNDLYVRRFAVQSLGSLGSDAQPAVPALSAILKAGTDKKEVLDAVAASLGKIGGTSTVASLTATLKDAKGDPGLRRQAAESLGKLGADARPALPVMTEIIKPGKKGAAMPNTADVRAEVATALGEIAMPTDKAAVEALEELAADRAIRRDRNLQKALNDALKKIRGKKA